jgi:phage shock protein A
MSKILGRRATDAQALARVETALGELVARMTETLVDAKNRVALAKKDELLLAKQAEVAARAAEQWGQRAMSAVRARDDVVARDALVRSHDCRRAAEESRAALANRRAEVDRMAAALAAESLRVEETKQRRNSVLLRSTRADAAGAVASALRAASPEQMLDGLEAALAVLDREARVAGELAEGPIDVRRVASELAVLKELVKAAPRAKKPLAKTTGNARDEGGSRAGASASRRTKR